jgi:hypothetical protein
MSTIEPLGPPSIIAYRTMTDPPQIVPGRPDRGWMDDTPVRYAYRCTPLSIANASGWEILCPESIIAMWDGRDALDGVYVRTERGSAAHFAVSHFGSGVLTFHPGYLFRTNPGWALWARGAPNVVKDGIAPLDGVVETDWLPFTFTMNWKFTRPGEVRFEEGEPFCFVTPFPHALVDDAQPVVRDISDDSELERHHNSWTADRLAFNAGLASGDPDAVARGWQRRYLRGETPDGSTSPFHRHRRRLRPFARPEEDS